MVKAVASFEGRGAALLAAGRAARKSSIEACDRRAPGVGRGSATTSSWPVPLVSMQPALADGTRAVVNPPPKAARRAAGRARAEQKQAEAEAPRAKKRLRFEKQVEQDEALLQPLAAADAPRSRRRSALAVAVLHEDEAVPDEQPQLPPLKPVSDDGQRRCNDVRARWLEFEEEMAQCDSLRAIWAREMAAGFPSQRLTLKWVKWLLSTRKIQSHATKREGREQVGRKASHVKQQVTWARNHVWKAKFGARGFPTGDEARAYWRPVLDHVTALIDGGGAGPQALANVAQAGAEAAQVAAGANAATVAAAGTSARGMAQQAVYAATAPSTTREHLNQTGEYILQDGLLSEPFKVNEASVLNAYTGFGRQTGCRPGMAVNVVQDVVDPSGLWANAPPLIVGDLKFGRFGEPLVLPTSKVAMSAYFEVSFERAKGQYFSCNAFGTAITPDSDEVLRCGTVSLKRLLLRTAAPRAVYEQLSAEEVVALRRKVDAPEGFAGLALEDTVFESWGALEAACDEDDWVVDEAAVDRPLFPAVDAETGNYMLGSGETFFGHELCKRISDLAASMGYHPSFVGAWSIRKDACEKQASGKEASDTMTAARVLGHRRVNSRTMDRVYRADLRLRDLGRYWRGAAMAAVLSEPLTSPSATRVPAAGAMGALTFSQLPEAAAAERASVEERAEVVAAREKEDTAREQVLRIAREAAGPQPLEGEVQAAALEVRRATSAVQVATNRAVRVAVAAAGGDASKPGALHLSKVSVPVREAVHADPDVVAAKATLSRVRAAKALLVPVPVGDKVTAAVREAVRATVDGETALKAYQAAQQSRSNAIRWAQQIAVGDFALRVWHEGQEKLRTVNGLRKARCTTHVWPSMTEAQAVAWGLERRDRTVEWRVLHQLPRALQWAIVEGGAFDALPTDASLLTGLGKKARTYDAVWRAVESEVVLCCPECTATKPLPVTAELLASAQCQYCMESMECEARVPTEDAVRSVWLGQCAQGRLGPRPRVRDAEGDEAEVEEVDAAVAHAHESMETVEEEASGEQTEAPASQE